MKRMFQQAVQAATTSANRPASGSLGEDEACGGSRRLGLLEAVPGVTHVETSQGNVGDHYCEQNLLVYSSTGPGSASPPIEFELTRNQHVKDQRMTPTVTAMFKDPKDGLIGEAWRILVAVGVGICCGYWLQRGTCWCFHP